MPDIASKPIVWTGVAIAGTVAVVVIAVFGLLHFERSAPGGERLQFDYRATLDAPGLASAPQPDLARDRQQKEQRLNSAGWVDQAAGIAHIPIGDAMDLLAQRAAKGKQP